LRNDYNTYAPNYGKQYSTYNGLELNVSARLRSGMSLQFGSSTGQTVTDNCEIRAALPEIAPTNPYCHNEPGVTTRATAAASYNVPKIDVILAGTFQSSPGGSLDANYTISATSNPVQWASIQQQLGRPLSGNVTQLSVNLLAPGQVRGERVNQIDFRVGKTLRWGRQRSTLSLDIFNLLNPDTILGYNETLNDTYLRATSVMTARTIKLTLQHDF
jgi:hypothetical protein